MKFHTALALCVAPFALFAASTAQADASKVVTLSQPKHAIIGKVATGMNTQCGDPAVLEILSSAFKVDATQGKTERMWEKQPEAIYCVIRFGSAREQRAYYRIEADGTVKPKGIGPI